MPTSRLPLEIKSFLIEYIDSISHLEVLLMLYMSPEKSWDAQTVSRELRSNVTAASIQLENLKGKGLIKLDENHLYRYSAAEHHEKVKLLIDIYHDKPVAVITCIFDKPTDKLKSFADAFKIKKD